MSVFNVFFDSPAQRPHQTYQVAWTDPQAQTRTARVENSGPRATVALGPIEAGPFRGEWVVTVYAGARLVHVEAVMKTDEDARAITYDAGLTTNVWFDVPPVTGPTVAWLDTGGQWHREKAAEHQQDAFHAVRHRTLSSRRGAGRSPASRRRINTSSLATSLITWPPPGRA